jgi:hypothetical protein
MSFYLLILLNFYLFPKLPVIIDPTESIAAASTAQFGSGAVPNTKLLDMLTMNSVAVKKIVAIITIITDVITVPIKNPPITVLIKPIIIPPILSATAGN